MGQEISRTIFDAGDFARFAAHLAAETALLGTRLREGVFSESPPLVAGCEIEGWLLDRHYHPVADNEAFLARLNDPLVVPELSRFNIELNCAPRALTGRVFAELRDDLARTWQACQRAAHAAGEIAMLIGILPNLRERDLSLANVSALNRYHALNAEVMRTRHGAPIAIDIQGRDRLRLVHEDVMLEAGTTSFQLHLQVPCSRIARFHNAAQLLAGPMVAVAANAPFLFGRDLWAETRVPLFEQAVSTGEGTPKRVTFGDAWLRESASELFTDNAARFAPLLPLALDGPAEHFAHVKLHNGTIWRWNRLLIATAPVPSLRLEHRVMAAGPTFIDMLANAALFYGAVTFLAQLTEPPERGLPFHRARDNFYRGARLGLESGFDWIDGQSHAASDLICAELVPMAREGLRQLDVADEDTAPLLDIIAQRARSGRNGAWWQRAWIARHPGDFVGLTARYVEHQRAGNPVHEWQV
ncbi:MAG: glutamate--cysteine ligase [Gammaproteobacteria bacterium]